MTTISFDRTFKFSVKNVIKNVDFERQKIFLFIKIKSFRINFHIFNVSQKSLTNKSST